MYKNLNAELARAGINKKELSVRTNIPYGTLLQKLRGEAPLLYTEAVAIKKGLGVALPLEELFFN